MTNFDLPGVATNIPRTIVMTGHFPPESGGIQTFTWELVRRLPPEQLLVIAPHWDGDREFDAGLPYPVIRRHGYLLFRDLTALVAGHHAEVGWITAMAPFGLYAGLLRRAGVSRMVGSTHGQELGWLRAAPTRHAFSRTAAAVDTLTYLTESTRVRIAPFVGDGIRMMQLAGGVDTARFHPGAGGQEVRRRYGFGTDPVVVTVGRLVRRKGFDVVMRAWPDVRRIVPRARLLVVGDGPMRHALTEWAKDQPDNSVVIASDVPAHGPHGIAACYDAGTVFLLACRDDRLGLQAEGLGLAVLEASASGLPVVVGRSGGSNESLLDGVTGWLIDAARPEIVAHKLVQVITAGKQPAAMGRAGRAWVRANWTWELAADRLAAALRGQAVPQRMLRVVRPNPDAESADGTEQAG
jgi:phosphatidylinositol alpha-1,6-mannosyltransferase